MNLLDQHPQICASGGHTTDALLHIQTGFPLEMMQPMGSPLGDLPEGSKCDLQEGCNYHFIEHHVKGIISNPSQRQRCDAATLQANAGDDWGTGDDTNCHFPRLCEAARRVEKGRDIWDVFLDAALTYDNEVLGCSCGSPGARRTDMAPQAFGTKVLAGWVIPRKGLLDGDSAIGQAWRWRNFSKIIRFTRDHALSRYLSLVHAQALANNFHANHEQDEKKLQNTKFHVDIEKLVKTTRALEKVDKHADDFARSLGVDVLWVQYERCRVDLHECIGNMTRFLGVAPHPGYIDEFHTSIHREADPWKHVENAREVQDYFKQHKGEHIK